ncbi:hypothetical protein [Lusitaniella coriacea]|uniref:hypothetical protein n=1 Tax=Lusitaniella coriacea TaxID=1983105 RepID=UPI003CF97B67
MNFKTLFLVTSLFFLGGCKLSEKIPRTKLIHSEVNNKIAPVFENNITSSHTNLDTAEAQVLKSALRLMYGSEDTEYDFSDGRYRVRWKPSIHEKRILGFDPNFVEAESKIILNYFYEKYNNRKLIILTETVHWKNNRSNRSWLCRLCGAPIGGAVFSVSESGHILEFDNYKLDLAHVGFQRAIDNAKIIDLGPQQKGVMFQYTKTSLGYEHTFLTIVADVYSQMEVVFSEIIGHNNTGSPLPGVREKKFWKHSSEIKFEEGDNSDYYDLILETSGTRYIPETDSVSDEFREVKRFVFNENKLEYRLRQ